MKNHLKETQRILADQLGLDESDITPDKNIYQDLGADSLDTVEIIMAFEEEYDIEIENEEGEKWKTVADIVAYLETNIPV